MDKDQIASIVSRVLSEVQDPGGGRTQMPETVCMTLPLARALADLVEAEAARRNMRVVVAVADGAGHTRLVHSMDDAFIGSLDAAVNKAFTCVAFRMSTGKLSALAQPGAPLYGIQHTNGGRIVIFGGGEPLRVNDRIIGALGISGGTAEEDEALAAWGAARLKEVISCL